MRIRKFIFLQCVFIFMILFSQHSIARPHVNKYSQDMRELALQECLNFNYTKIGAYKINNLKDSSFWTYKYGTDQKFSMEGLDNLFSFVDKKTGHFYQEILSLKNEEGPRPPNAIFARCMRFYKSKELKDFVKTAKQ